MLTPLPPRGLYAITDSTLLADGRLLPAVEAALQGGAAVLQYRDKSTDQPRRRAEAEALLALCRRYRVPLLINDDVELALAIGADGVHLGRGDAALAAARARLGPAAILGATCHDSLAFASEAVAAGADYLAFGAFYPSATKPGAQAAPVAVLSAARALGRPVVAIGGITVDNAPPLLRAGADFVAVISDLFAGPHIAARARAFAALFQESAP